MKNEEKYKTPKERAEAFDAFCNRQKDWCVECTLGESPYCKYEWLELEADTEDEKPLPCPCCSGESKLCTDRASGGGQVRCTVCGLSTLIEHSPAEAIAKWNRRAK